MSNRASAGDAGGREPELVGVDEAVTAVVRGVIPTGELAGFFDASFRKLGETVAAQQVAVISPAFGLFRESRPGTADLEVGFVTDRPIRAEGDVVAGSLPGGRVARLIHFGAFDQLGASWDRLRSWIGEQGLSPGPVTWESYLTKPSPDMDPRDLRTELNWPIAE
jgi:effector-binding domain-containing protein